MEATCACCRRLNLGVFANVRRGYQTSSSFQGGHKSLMRIVRQFSQMRLRVISDYGSTERVVTDEATPEIATKTMDSLDWQGFHQVVLERPNGDWMEVGGSLDPSDGLSMMYEEKGKQFVIKVPPTTVDEMTRMLLRYLSGTEAWKKENEWE